MLYIQSGANDGRLDSGFDERVFAWKSELDQKSSYGGKRTGNRFGYRPRCRALISAEPNHYRHALWLFRPSGLATK